MSNLFDSFLALPNASGVGSYQAISLSDRRQDFLGKSAAGAPIFLLHDSSDATYNPGINFRHLSAEFHATCRVQTDGDAIEGQFCLVWCDDSAPELHELFVRCVAAAIEELPDASETKDLESCILRLRNLFRALAAPGVREISGLWAELFVILKSGNPTQALACWHAGQFDKFDFSRPGLHLEVKSTLKRTRSHDFSLEQLQPPMSGAGFVASVMLQMLTGGLGVLDLARSIEANVHGSPRLKQKLWENVALSLGVDFSDLLDKKFDMSYAERGFAMYDMSEVPRPASSGDPRVTDIRFVSDLTGIQSDRPFEVLSAAMSKQ
ncbi:PD-(D/E)XK motif protein [Dyella flava]|uniref:PD-(D/E)XK motif protein n=1 Tax=Dyella flava TaxID=1920170 RepID=A0ABS2K7K4_9GAMM|nr:PD-(D/E)XK motif protein [Dyella flava]MBM7126700.1 PD-(D/E)XK motif protein [Dyella flava]